MSDKLRLFAGVTVPAERIVALHDHLADFEATLNEARWTDPTQAHVTLKFIGWLSGDRVDDVIGACEKAWGRGLAMESRLTDLGAFPSARRARVLWAGIEDPGGAIASVAEALDRSLEDLGIPVEKREFVPHLTLARFKEPHKLPARLPDLGTDAGSPFDVTRMILFRSHVSSKGARYECLHAFDSLG